MLGGWGGGSAFGAGSAWVLWKRPAAGWRKFSSTTLAPQTLAIITIIALGNKANEANGANGANEAGGVDGYGGEQAAAAAQLVLNPTSNCSASTLLP